jgi:hypothetical protein
MRTGYIGAESVNVSLMRRSGGFGPPDVSKNMPFAVRL